MRVLVIGLLSLLVTGASAENAAPPEPTITLTQSELAIHDESIAQRAAAAQVSQMATVRSQVVDDKIAKAFHLDQTPIPKPGQP